MRRNDRPGSDSRWSASGRRPGTSAAWTLVVSAAVVGVLGLAAVVGLIAANTGKSGDSAKDGPVVAPSGASGKDALAIQTGKGEAKSTLTVWEDFRCPACKAFEDNYRDTIHDLEAKGLLKVDYHLVTLIDGNMGGSGSLKSANAAACAQDSRQVHRLPRRALPEPAAGGRRRLRQGRQAAGAGGQGRRAGHPGLPFLRRGRHAQQLGGQVAGGLPGRRSSGAPRPCCWTARTSSPTRRIR